MTGWLCKECFTLDGEALELHIQAHARSVVWSYDEVKQAIMELREQYRHCFACQDRIDRDLAPVVPVVRFDRQPLTTEQVEALRKLYSPQQFEQLKAWAQRYFTGLGQAFENIRETMKSMGLATDPGEEYDDPRDRALAARRNRNTGPARPSAAQARRPRRHR